MCDTHIYTLYVIVSVNINDFNQSAYASSFFHISYYILSVALAVALAIVVAGVIVVAFLITAFVLHSLVCAIVLFLTVAWYCRSFL